MMASVYHRIIKGMKKRVETSSWLVAPSEMTRANRSVIRKKRTRESQPSHAATFCVISIRDEVVGQRPFHDFRISAGLGPGNKEGDPFRTARTIFAFSERHSR